MNFYLDFEATRFSNRIISIGCVAGNGATFETLVKPGDKKKVDKFITELTGITNEMLADAPDADVAFHMLYDFIEANNDEKAPAYYVYGNSDADFINATLKHMEDTLACVCAQAIAGNLIDYASVVKKFFVAKSDLALRKVYMLIKDQEELVQKHDALEDAKMLETVVAHLHDKCKPEDKDTILAMPSQSKPRVGKRAPETFLKWNNITKWEAETGADENNWMLKCVDQHCGKAMYFNDFNTAALWVIKYTARNVSPKNPAAVQKIEAALKSAPQTGKCRYNCFWEYSPEGAIAAALNDNGKENA
jgi:DNA polymerase III epsilon subunit-like protein